MTDDYVPNSPEVNELIDLIHRYCAREKLDFRSYIRGVFAREGGDPTEESIRFLVGAHAEWVDEQPAA